MKIKKVAQTPGVLATVSTSKIDSDKDTYSCNYLNDNAVVVSPTEPSDGKVWIDNVNKKIHTKTDNGYEEFYSEENREVYSTSEQRIGTWIDGKPLYRQVFSGLQCPNNGVGKFTNMKQNTDKIIRLEGIFTDKASVNEHWFVIFGKNEVGGMGLNFNQYSGTLYLVSTKDMSKYTCDVIMEYTKTTD